MSNINKTIKVEGVSHDCKTLGELLDTFQVKLSYFMNEKKRSFLLDFNQSPVFHQYNIIDYYENPLHVFLGTNNTYNIEYVLDVRHQRIYSIEHDKKSLKIREYDLDGELLNIIESDEDYDIDEVIIKYLKRDYFCYDIGELLDAFNLDFEISDNLRGHVLIERENQSCDYCCGHRISFCDYDMEVINNRTLYVFKSMFDNDTIVFDSEPPIYYLDPERQFLFVETKGMVGICILQFDENNEIVKDAHSWIVDMEMFLQLTQQ